MYKAVLSLRGDVLAADLTKNSAKICMEAAKRFARALQ